MEDKKTAPRILILEDDTVIRQELDSFLQKNGYDILAPALDFTNLSYFVARQPDLILLDIGLGSQNGIMLCQELKKLADIPIIFVTGQDTTQNEIEGFKAGADDYIKKPYHLSLLLLRIRQLLKRTNKDNDPLTVNGVTLDLVFGQLLYEEEGYELSKKEQQILYYLFQNHPKIVGRDELIQYLWENKLFVDENILNVNLSRIRKRLKGTPLQEFIRTIPEQGYQLGGAASCISERT